MDLASFKSLLTEFVSFKSVSTDPMFKPEIQKTVDWLSKIFTDNGFLVETWQADKINPVVFASFQQPLTSNQQPLETVLVYGHYDVQPAEKADGWEDDPFTLRDGGERWFARGVIDNKGQILIHIFTVLKLIKEKKLKYNVKFLIEGDEETGEKELGKLIEQNKEKLKTDFVLVSDGEIAGKVPLIECSLRGGFNLTLKFKTANNNLHSGIFGSAAPNAAQELSKVVAGLYDQNNQCVVPHFYDDVDPISEEQRQNGQRLLEVTKDSLDQTGIKKWLTEEGLDFYCQTGLRPSLQVTGFKSGYIGEGYANIVPATAEVRINFRTVPSQKPEDVLQSFEDYVKSVVPDYVDFEISHHGMHDSVKVDLSSPKVSEVKKMLEDSFGIEPLIKHVGGAIPVVSDFKNVLGVNTLLVPLCNDDCNMHGVEENFKLDLLKKGLEFSESFFGQR